MTAQEEFLFSFNLLLCTSRVYWSGRYLYKLRACKGKRTSRTGRAYKQTTLCVEQIKNKIKKTGRLYSNYLSLGPAFIYQIIYQVIHLHCNLCAHR